MAPDIGISLFAGWKFIRSNEDDLIYFADCRQQGIGEFEFDENKKFLSAASETN
ncbi:hypothetical protein N9043_00875 [bacterium]|nr:hypothetical protein [bacterium]